MPLPQPLRRDLPETSLTTHPLVFKNLEPLSCHVWLTKSATKLIQLSLLD